MEIRNILYTPLDVPQRPCYDLNQFKFWVKENYKTLFHYKEILSITGNAAEQVIENYPWDLTVAYFNLFDDRSNGWLGDFNLQFPELATYLYESFNLTIDELGLIVFLPIKANHTGLGFWHNDTDSFGLRHYLFFDRPDENKLLLRKTKINYTVRQNFQIPKDEHLFQEEIFECKLLSSTQSFFLNNINSVHSTYTQIPNLTRITAFVAGKIGKGNDTRKKVEDLIVRSAEKYKEYAIFWN